DLHQDGAVVRVLHLRVDPLLLGLARAGAEIGHPVGPGEAGLVRQVVVAVEAAGILPDRAAVAAAAVAAAVVTAACGQQEEEPEDKRSAARPIDPHPAHSMISSTRAPSWIRITVLSATIELIPSAKRCAPSICRRQSVVKAKLTRPLSSETRAPSTSPVGSSTLPPTNGSSRQIGATGRRRRPATSARAARNVPEVPPSAWYRKLCPAKPSAH